MKEKHRNLRNDKKHVKRNQTSSSSSSSGSEEWVEKSQIKKTERDDWMAMTGMLKTYTKDDIHSKREENKKNNIESYNPSTSCRELNPYWKDGGSGLPQTAESFRQSKKFLKPLDDDDYYTKSSNRMSSSHSKEKKNREFLKPSDDDNYYRKPDDTSNNFRSERSSDDKEYYTKSSSRHSEKKRCDHDQSRRYNERKSFNWRKDESDSKKRPVDSSSNQTKEKKTTDNEQVAAITNQPVLEKSEHKNKYLSDEKMNKLAAKLVKAEIMGDTKLIGELKDKLEAAREYRKENPDAKPVEEEDEGVMLIATTSTGNSRPLAKTSKGDTRSKGGKRKAETHLFGERAKYFGNDDKYNLAQMFENEKYGNNYNDDAELARIASKSKNPNDDLEDIFIDEISKNCNEAKDNETEKNRAISQHKKMEKSLEGCEYCVDSKNMLKHLMVSCATKVYVALPSTKSLVEGHCLIATVQHATCVTALDEDVWEEIMNYRKAITQFFNSQNKDVVFFETATRLHRFPHMVINCVPLPRDVGDMAAIYFKKALLECEAEWSMNKKVVDLKGKNIRKGVPKGLPYFWIDFGMDPGFAHVIEDQQLFPKCFAQEIIAGILDLDHRLWKNPKKEFGELQRKKVVEFLKEWKAFDPIKNT